MRSRLGLILCVLSLLAGCGGDGSSAPTPPVVTPPPPPPPLIGSSGGTVTEATGASVIVPAGALTTDTTIRIARDSTGAPAMPAELTAAGSVYVITPHGGDFAQPVKVRIPVPSGTLLPTQEYKLAKAQPDGPWEVLGDTQLVNGSLEADVRSFSFFSVVTITYLLPILQVAPFAVTSASINCTNGPCTDRLAAVTATYAFTTNSGGQIPSTCVRPTIVIADAEFPNLRWPAIRSYLAVPLAGGSLTKSVTNNRTYIHTFGLGYLCEGYFYDLGDANYRSVTWLKGPAYPAISVVDMAAELEVAEGYSADVFATFHGGAAHEAPTGFPPPFYPPTADDRAIIDWQRSDDGGASWRVIARSYQNEGNPLPYGPGAPWRPWSVSHRFIATATDQGALIRAHACYTPPEPAVAPPPCVSTPATRINVLQQNALPVIANSPRSVLVRTGQTANLSATATGLPAPALQWQSRAANSSGAWSNVSAGTGATTANYTTAATTLADNGIQYRMVATNALGNVASNTVTVSVSDLDVAPSITTQPANINVTSGNDAVFAVVANGTEALSYQWHFNGTAISGANSPVLRLSAVTLLRAGGYSVTVSNAAGDVDSNIAVLDVSAGTPAAAAPSIVTQPASLDVNVGNTATFAVGVNGSGPFTFQWRRNGFNIPGATSAVLVLPSVVSDASGTYSVIVNNSVGPAVTSADASLSVSSVGGAVLPTIVTQPSTIVVAQGGSAVLAVAASGSGPLSYQWARDGVPINGATEAVLILAPVTASDAADFSVTVSNNLGYVVSQSASVILLGAPVIWTSPSSVHAFENSTTTFRVDAAGPNLHYQWLRNGSPIGSSDSDAYTTPSLTVADSGAVYSVIVYNGAGLLVSDAAVLTVTVPVPPTVLQQPADVTIQAGELANLCMAFGGTPPFSVQMNRWDGTQWAPIGSPMPVNDNAQVCISTPNLQLADNGAQFLFFASNAEGGILEAMTRTVTVTVTAPTGVTAATLVSRGTSGAPADNRSHAPSLSADGNLVAFISDGTNLVPGFATTFGHAYVRNLQTGVTTVINQTVEGTESGTGVVEMKMAADGRYVVFSSLAGDLVYGDTNGSLDVFRRDLLTGTTERVNILANGDQLPGTGNGIGDMRLDISADGTFIIWSSFFDMAGNGEALPNMALFVRNVQSQRTTLVGSGDGYNIQYAAISPSGEYIAYSTPATAPVRERIWLYDNEADDMYVAFTMDPVNGVDYLGQGLSVSNNGRFVAFALRSVPLLGTAVMQTVVIDRNDPDNLILASAGSAGSGIGLGTGTSNYPKLSADGRYVLFSTQAPNISGGTGNTMDSALMVRDLQTQTISVASRRANGTSVRTALLASAGFDISDDGSTVIFGAWQLDMDGGPNEQQLYAAPRP